MWCVFFLEAWEGRRLVAVCDSEERARDIANNFSVREDDHSVVEFVELNEVIF
jgi:hypothetical protein